MGEKVWKHDELLEDLAGYLRAPDRMVWCDMQLGPSGSPRPDVFTIQKSYSKPLPAAFEIKVSRSDLRSDTTSGKWQSYLQFAGSVTFAVPDGLCTVADIPDSCGLIVRKNAVWRYVRKPTVQKVEISFSACMKLLIDGVSRVSVRRDPVPRRVSEWSENASVRKKFGAAVEQAARDLMRAEKQTADLKGIYRREMERVTELANAEKARLMSLAQEEAAKAAGCKADLCRLLGIEANSSAFAIERAMAAFRSSCDADSRVIKAERDLASARSCVDQAATILRSHAPAPIAPAWRAA